MKLNIGSIQRKGNRLYLVVRRNGHQQWLSLKTSVAATAKKRAMQLLSPESDEVGWLNHLAELGRNAEQLLRHTKLVKTLKWGALLDTFVASSQAQVPKQTLECYSRWVDILEEASDGLGIAEIDRSKALVIASRLSIRYVSWRRMMRFYKRCWTAIGLDGEIWDLKGIDVDDAHGDCKANEFYRRLTLTEIRGLHTHLCQISIALADMVAIGYATGLRLSDVAELDTTEVVDGGKALSIVPNKTSHRKRRPLYIPLVHEASDSVARRLLEANGDENPRSGGKYLFPPDMRSRPSRRISQAFRQCGIAQKGRGRASFHSLRATFISMMDEAGVPPHLTDAITGHAGGGMHARYTQPSPAALRSAILSALPPLRISETQCTAAIPIAKPPSVPNQHRPDNSSAP